MDLEGILFFEYFGFLFYIEDNHILGEPYFVFAIGSTGKDILWLKIEEDYLSRFNLVIGKRDVRSILHHFGASDKGAKTERALVLKINELFL